MVWRSAGIGWSWIEGPVLRWVGAEQVSPLSYGTKVGAAEAYRTGAYGAQAAAAEANRAKADADEVNAAEAYQAKAEGAGGAESSGEVLLGTPPGVPPVAAGGANRVAAYGRNVAFRVVGERQCLGVRGNPCPRSAVVAGRATQAQCAECARLDRSRSVAADTMADDPRPYAVYLAWFGPGMVKVGITREDRGPARLLEQGAVAFSWLGRGPLMAARRCEELLRAGLGVPDRISYAKKRAVRDALPGLEERAAEVRELHARAVGLEGWPEALGVAECEVVDHAGVFGLEGLVDAGGVAGVVRELVNGGSVAGRVVAVAGPDLHLEVEGVGAARVLGAVRGPGASGAARAPGGPGAPGVVVVDSRLLAGWGLERGEGDAAGGVTVPVTWVEKGAEAGVQEGLF
ncbi:DUF2797 domain-containing protein [Streptomyces sp. NPDC058657]|uniref:DUF2797 domain-containing protein n=1 Tax=unclassified Streptomyces TaxID=2593676 RepID=UPI00365807A5